MNNLHREEELRILRQLLTSPEISDFSEGIDPDDHEAFSERVDEFLAISELELLDGQGKIEPLSDSEKSGLYARIGVHAIIDDRADTNGGTKPVDGRSGGGNDAIDGEKPRRKSHRNLVWAAVSGVPGVAMGSGATVAGMFTSAGSALGPMLGAGSNDGSEKNPENDVRNPDSERTMSSESEQIGSHGSPGDAHESSNDNHWNSDHGDHAMTDEPRLGFAQAPTAFGNPPDASPMDIYQGYADTCAIRSQEIILRDYGLHVPQEQLIAEAAQHGWYSGSGTSMPDVGKLLELHGIPVSQQVNGNVFSLATELAQGHRVIVGVDSQELMGNKSWLRNWIEDKLDIQSPDHALPVSGIDTSDPQNVLVTLTDPGTGEVAKTYTWEQFESAWKDSGCFMVSTQAPVPDMPNFDYAQGHLDSVMNVPYDHFVQQFSPAMGLSVSDPWFTMALDELNFFQSHPDYFSLSDPTSPFHHITEIPYSGEHPITSAPSGNLGSSAFDPAHAEYDPSHDSHGFSTDIPIHDHFDPVHPDTFPDHGHSPFPTEDFPDSSHTHDIDPFDDDFMPPEF